MDIQPLTHDVLEEVCEWLANLNKQDDHFVAWLESGKEEIYAQLAPLLSFETTLLWVGREKSEIVGFIGLLPFFEQHVCRILGPFSTKGNATHSMQMLWERAHHVAKQYFDIAKVAFFNQNQALKEFSEQHHFHCYNREKSLLLSKEAPSLYTIDRSNIELYRDEFAQDILRLHPHAAYYTTEEMLQLAKEDGSHLWCYVVNEHVKGYVYFEEIVGTDEGELCFVNVEEGERDQGIGRTLIQYACFQAFHSFKLSLVTISVRDGNPKAEKLYKELGFTEGPTIVAYQKELNTIS